MFYSKKNDILIFEAKDIRHNLFKENIPILSKITSIEIGNGYIATVTPVTKGNYITYIKHPIIVISQIHLNIVRLQYKLHINKNLQKILGILDTDLVINSIENKDGKLYISVFIREEKSLDNIIPVRKFEVVYKNREFKLKRKV